ncbi:polyprenyl diphosphate synthase [Candidatus Lariskella endosymbiont of Hedychridium roseum]|uniref:polyprenyl diphosphate synthase n=1 Tax=Candidatus Lariskella endosymbiont of Hedychridium roseum TaxID=3077949 RepID=UPI0030CF5472
MQKIPKHIAIIMDGNGRWALQNGLRKEEGHREGIVAAERILKASIANGVKYLTLYAFSSENWARPNSEVSNLMNLLHKYLLNNTEDLISSGVKVIFIGDKSSLDPAIQELMQIAESSSAHNKFHLVIAISYGARNEIRNAALEMCKYVISNKIEPNTITSKLFDNFINSDIPDPDLLIRTGGERRISNFLLWQIAYTELYFSDKLWPAFSEADLIDAIKDFSARDRRYGR